MLNDIIIYSIITFFLMYVFTKISYNYDLLDKPNKRKIHLKPTSYIGGILISIALVISIQLFDITAYKLNLILSISFIMAAVGFIDDKFKLNTGGKLSLQIIPIFFLIVIENLNLIQLGDYNHFQIKLNSFSIPFTLLAVLFLINAFNYFDGLDGTLGFASISTFIILYFLVPGENLKLYIITIALPVCIFLIFNFSIFNLPKLFLGDSGSLLLGFLVSFLLIYLANKNLVHPILLAWSIAIFVYEFLAINLQRLINKKNLFTAGLDHLHHIIFKKTKSIFLTNFSIFFINITFFFIGYLSFKFIDSITSLIFFIIFFIIFFFLRKILTNYK